MHTRDSPHLRGRGRIVKNSRSSLVTLQVLGQPRLKTPYQKSNSFQRIKARKTKASESCEIGPDSIFQSREGSLQSDVSRKGRAVSSVPSLDHHGLAVPCETTFHLHTRSGCLCPGWETDTMVTPLPITKKLLAGHNAFH